VGTKPAVATAEQDQQITRRITTMQKRNSTKGKGDFAKGFTGGDA
jgi:hypothetical protein